MSEGCNNSTYNYTHFTDLEPPEKIYVIANYAGIGTNGLVLLFYTWGIYQAIKFNASTFVKIVETLILFSAIHFLASCIFQAYTHKCFVNLD